MKFKYLIVLLVFGLVGCTSHRPEDEPLRRDLERMLGNTFEEVIRDLHMRDLFIIESSPEIYRAVRGKNKKNELIYLYVKSSNAVNSLEHGVAKPSSFYDKTVAGIRQKKGGHWVDVGTGHFDERSLRHR